MIFSTAAVRSLSSSLLVVAMAATTPSGVGGATTTNRKLNKNSPTSSPAPTTMCPTATLYYPLAIDNTIGSRHIVQRFPAATPAGSEKICPDGVVCIGDTYTEFNTLYADKGLTQQVATLASTAKVVNIKADGARMNMITAAIVYEETLGFLTTELNYVGVYEDEEFAYGNQNHDLAVSGGTFKCAFAFGTIDFHIGPENDYGSVEFNLADMTI